MKKNVLQLLEEITFKYPEKIALCDDNQVVNFRKYTQHSKAIGTFLAKEYSTGFSRPILIFVDRNVENLISFMGVLYSRNFYVPIDSKTPLERIKNIIAVINPVAIIGFNEQDFFISASLNVPFHLYADIAFNEIDHELIDRIRQSSLDVDPAYAIFTSGSTGIPKAVLISHRAVLDLTHWLVNTFEFSSTDCLGNQTPFYFDASVKDIYISLSTGAKLVVISKKCFSFPALLGEVLIKNEVTSILWATSAVVLVAKSGVLDTFEWHSLKRVFFAGEAMFGKHLNIWRKKHPQSQYINLYGPTEVTVDSTYYIVERNFKDSDIIPIGRHCDNKEVFILDNEGNIDLSAKSGELAIRGAGVALGYYNNPEQTARFFIQNPLHNCYRDILYKTGDYVRVNEYGEIEFTGRKDFQVKLHGNRIELGEIEAACYGIARIEHVACVFDELNSRIILFYSALEEIDSALIYKELSKAIPKYMFPSKFQFVKEMPLTPNGKVDRKTIRLLINA